MADKILITGGAGFVGSHTTDALLAAGYAVRVLDNLEPQVHGEEQRVPEYLDVEVDFWKGDVRNKDDLKKAIEGVDAIIHLAAAVGVGQSMYEIRKYVEVNTLGGANLLDILANERHSVKKVVVASSMSVYGEGGYLCNNGCGPVYPGLRPKEQLAQRDWEMKCPMCRQNASPIPTNEDKILHPASIYAISKRDHEEMFLNVGRAYGIPTVALRYFNIYGSRQALSNPYTGVAAIFLSRILNNNPPLIFEDGLQSRDFVHVSDIVQANLLALEKQEANYEVFNVGAGRQLTVMDMARILSDELGFEQKPIVLNKFREGDTRHCYSNITKIKNRLGFEPKMTFEQGIKDLIEWVRAEDACDFVEEAKGILFQKGLLK